jgi:hypothetical protein
MSDLGTLSTKRLRPRFAFAVPGPFDRTFPDHRLRRHIAVNFSGETGYTYDRAHYPVRLNGRACNFHSGPSIENGYPWTVEAQPVTDADGVIFWHSHRYPLLWAVSIGDHTIDVHVKHQAGAGLKPALIIHANAALGIADQRIDSTAADDTDDTLHADVSPILNGTIFCELISENVAENKKTTWGLIETT